MITNDYEDKNYYRNDYGSSIDTIRWGKATQ